MINPPLPEPSHVSLADDDLLRGFPLSKLMVRVGGRHAPYGFLLWESSVALARWIAAKPELLRGKGVLELGAGVGLPGLVARSLGASVTQTDHLPQTLALSSLNGMHNGVDRVHRFAADWAVAPTTAIATMLLECGSVLIRQLLALGYRSGASPSTEASGGTTDALCSHRALPGYPIRD